MFWASGVQSMLCRSLSLSMDSDRIGDIRNTVGVEVSKGSEGERHARSFGHACITVSAGYILMEEITQLSNAFSEQGTAKCNDFWTVVGREYVFILFCKKQFIHFIVFLRMNTDTIETHIGIYK